MCRKMAFRLTVMMHIAMYFLNSRDFASPCSHSRKAKVEIGSGMQREEGVGRRGRRETLVTLAKQSQMQDLGRCIVILYSTPPPVKQANQKCFSAGNPILSNDYT